MSTVGIEQIALQSARLELEYERILRRTDQIYEEERSRQLRVQLLLQEDTVEDLREDVYNNEDALQQSEESAREMQDRLADMEEQYEITQSELKACMRDIDQYQAEINAFNASSSENTKTLTEKLALSRELKILRPELDHLRSQVSHHDNILADKLSLERELATAQLELDSEKKTVARLKQRSQSIDPSLTEELEELKATLAKERKTIAKMERQNTKRTNEKSSADAALVDELESLKTALVDAQVRTEAAEKRVQEAETKQTTGTDDTILEELRKDLAKERKNTQKLEREQLKKAAEWDGQKETMEKKLDAFRTKLRSAKEQLKEAQDELERREAAKFAESAAATKARMRGVSVEPARGPTTGAQVNNKKRSVARFDPDMTIGTPGNGAQAAKRQRLTGSILGDKSTFSITPFLNRTTMSVLPESPEGEADKDEHDKINEAINTSINELAEEAEKEEASKKLMAGKKPAEKKATTSKITDKKVKVPSGKANATGTTQKAALPKVTEEEEIDQENVTSTTNKTTDPTIAASDTIANPQPKKKKLLGARRNIFDDDDRGSGIGKRPVGLGLNKVKLGNNKPKVLAVFSPLKKDRRAAEVGAVGA